MTILIFLFILFVLVLVHEWGHFIVAKKTGMRVDEFGIGFPPKALSLGRKNGTEYTLNWLPIGGFVKIYGEDMEDAGGVKDSRAFSAKSKWAQAAVLIAGVTMNVLLAFVLFSIALTIGVQTAVSESEASSNARLVITEIVADSPAERAGLPAGVVIERMVYETDELEKPSPSEFSAFISEYGSVPLTVVYSQGGEIKEVVVTPATGLIPDDASQHAVGVALTLTDVVGRSIPVALYESVILTGASLKNIVVGVSGLIYDAVLLDADFSNIAGPVGIVGLVGDASAFGITSLLMFTAFISLNLAIINLLPFPALDGGRLLFVGIEAIKGSPIKPTYVQALNTVGFALLILLMIAVTWNDIARIL